MHYSTTHNINIEVRNELLAQVAKRAERVQLLVEKNAILLAEDGCMSIYVR